MQLQHLTHVRRWTIGVCLGAAWLPNTTLGATPPLQVEVTSATSNSISLAWTGGVPAYQLQSRARLSDPWTLEGAPTNTTTRVVPRTGDQRFYRVVSDYTAQYEVVFNATWSNQTHPGAWVSSAHWSGLIGGAHNSDVSFWQLGSTATEGIRVMSELGGQTQLNSEVNTAIAAGTADFVLRGGGLGTSPGAVTYRFPQRMSRDYPLVTLCSMVAPSPDWFVGVTGLSLIEENGEWATEKVVPLFSHDAGTDSGTNFTSANSVTNPRDVITQHAGYPALINRSLVPFGTFTFRRLN